MPEARGLYEVSREKMRARHFAYRTEQAYLYWIRRYVNFHNRKHPREMGVIVRGGISDSPRRARACKRIHLESGSSSSPLSISASIGDRSSLARECYAGSSP